jgi:hypothetical protein
MTRTHLLQTSVYELDLELRQWAQGHHLQLVSFIPRARRPHRQTQFQTVLSQEALAAMYSAIGAALCAEWPDPKE